MNCPYCGLRNRPDNWCCALCFTRLHFDARLCQLKRWSEVLLEIMRVSKPETVIDLAIKVQGGIDDLLEYVDKQQGATPDFGSILDTIGNRVIEAIKFAKSKMQESWWRKVFDVLCKVVSGIAKLCGPLTPFVNFNFQF